MRTTPLLAGLALLLTLAAIPTAAAGHSGPTCTHEYVESYKDLDEVAPNCAANTVQWVWAYLGLGVVTSPWP